MSWMLTTSATNLNRGSELFSSSIDRYAFRVNKVEATAKYIFTTRECRVR